MSSPELALQTEPADHKFRERLVSDIFHVISQPLTGLHCLLEVSLMKQQTAAGYRRDIQSALEATSRLAESLRQARELAEADAPGILQAVNLSEVIAEVTSEFQPIMEASHIEPIVSLHPGSYISADPVKLRRAIFCLFDTVLHDFPLGSQLLITLEGNPQVVVFIGPKGAMDRCGAPVVTKAPSLAVADRILAAIGGRLLMEEGPTGKSIRIEFPEHQQIGQNGIQL